MGLANGDRRPPKFSILCAAQAKRLACTVMDAVMRKKYDTGCHRYRNLVVHFRKGWRKYDWIHSLQYFSLIKWLYSIFTCFASESFQQRLRISSILYTNALRAGQRSHPE